MKDPERLVNGHASPVLRSLLSAAVEEQPPAELLERTLAPLGVGVATLAAVSASSVESAAAVGTSVGGAAAGVTATTSVVPHAVVGSTFFVTTLKWVGVASIGVTVAAGTASELDLLSNVVSKPVSSGRTNENLAAKVHSTAETRRATAPNPAPVPAVSGATTVIESRATPEPSVPRRTDEPRLRLGEEAKLIDQVRHSVATGDATGALRTLEVHRRRFPRPLLEPEAMYLEMRARELRGQELLARRAAERLLAAYPNGAQAAHARALLKAREK